MEAQDPRMIPIAQFLQEIGTPQNLLDLEHNERRRALLNLIHENTDKLCQVIAEQAGPDTPPLITNGFGRVMIYMLMQSLLRHPSAPEKFGFEKEKFEGMKILIDAAAMDALMNGQIMKTLHDAAEDFLKSQQ